MVVSKSSSQLQNILDLKGRERSSSAKYEGPDFSETLKEKSKEIRLSERDDKDSDQDKVETHGEIAAHEPQDQTPQPKKQMKQESDSHLEGSQKTPESDSAMLRPIQLDGKPQNAHESKIGKEEWAAKSFLVDALAKSDTHPLKTQGEVVGQKLSHSLFKDEGTLPQVGDFQNLASDDLLTAPFKEDTPQSFGQKAQNDMKMPLSTSSSELKSQSLQNQSPENDNVLSELMKDMEALETPEFLPNGTVEQKATPSLQDKLLSQLRVTDALKAASFNQTTSDVNSSLTQPVVSVSGEAGGFSFDQGSSDLNQDQIIPNDDALANFAPIENQDRMDFAKPLSVAQAGLNTETTPDSKIENMSSIIREARAIVDDGGGSMEIHLQPEGLGKVQLKVAVHEGRINVEMMTDNPAAKKALEEGLFEVRNALEGQKLLVDTMKVEMGQNVQKDFSDMRDHMQEQQNRDFAQDFLEQFRQDRENRFGGLIDRFRNSPQPMTDNELKLTGRNPYAESGKGRTLNLVA